MAQTSTETVSGYESFHGGDETTAEESILSQCFENVKQYVRVNKESTNTQLFSFLALLNEYIPNSYLLMHECQQILGPPDPIHGGPPFEARMEPFTTLINTSSPRPDHVCMINPLYSESAVELLAGLGLSRSATVKKFMFSLCGDQPQPHIIQFIKELLTIRKVGEKGKDKFSRLIEDILKNENCYNAVIVLETASDKFREYQIFPQTIARLYNSKKGYEKAEKWARTAIERAPNNSYVADTLAQISKNRLLREARSQEDILNRAQEAFEAFGDVERKADNEEGLEMRDTAGTVSVSNTFNNRGRFGFIQVAKIAFEKLRRSHPFFIENLTMKVEATFDFFEWYLTYSKADRTSLEPPYFWKDIVHCYEYYTTKTAANSTSFPGLLECLNHGLFTSKGSRAGTGEAVETVSRLEAIQVDLKTAYEANDVDVNIAERYILSNIILSNKMHNSPQLTPVMELQTIIRRFLGTEVGRRSSEFYLLVLLLFWPEEPSQEVQEKDDEEVPQQATEDEGYGEPTTWVDEEQETSGEPAQPSLEHMFGINLQQQVTFMEKVFEKDEYAKYLRGRNLLPLFFLGKGTGLSKWVHKSKLDAIVEIKVDVELAGARFKRNKRKWRSINEMWKSGKVWQVPEIQDILLPVELWQSFPTMPQKHQKQKVSVRVGGKEIVATTEVQPEASALSSGYLGFTIQGPVVFPHTSGQ